MKYILKELKNAVTVDRVANVHFFEFENNFSTESDAHPFCELVFVASGELMVFSDDYNGKLRKNEMIIHRADMRHSLSCTVKHAPTVIIIGFSVKGAELDGFSFTPTLLRDGSIKQLAEIVKEGRNVFAPPYDVPAVLDMKKKPSRIFGAEQMLRNLLESFLIGLVREKLYHLKEAGKDERQIPAVREVISYVEDNFTERITLDELAFLFKTNRTTLCREFKRATGKTVIEFINDKKLVSAKQKITESEKTFTEISDELGFLSIHYFTRFFKAKTGMSPKAYRESVRKTRPSQ